jgi:hypothetical protein
VAALLCSQSAAPRRGEQLSRRSPARLILEIDNRRAVARHDRGRLTGIGALSFFDSTNCL